ncbi:MarR family transcriptional regulator [Oscillibacter sp.]|uniref:MarR family winged helix-turn-helix transcriptional regulator n=1 Tax=Oscillibacter sp. TaxID=1945593 RepID=UPI0026390A5D|nr:MarR family transcriptional regulator [Oscillibacter sp.]MDD3346701.1 MarR family transcriptional regulator [Oscillibacter sp.]
MSKNIEEQLAALNRLYKEQDDLYRTYAVKKGISVTEFWILYALCSSDDPHSQQELCDTWFYPKQTINSAINKLTRNDYVALKPAAGAGNRKNVQLTKAGKAFCQSHIEPLINAEEAAFLRFGEEERNTYLSLFQKQIAYLKDEIETNNKELSSENLRSQSQC